MSVAAQESPAIQRPLLLVAAILAAALFFHLWGQSTTRALVLLIGLGLGIALYHAAFGFTAAYRRAMVDKDLSGIAAQVVMLILAMAIFAPAGRLRRSACPCCSGPSCSESACISAAPARPAPCSPSAAATAG